MSVKQTSKTRKEQRELPLLGSASRFETVQALKAAIPARAALAGLTQALKQSPLSRSAINAFSLQESVGLLQLDGDVVNLASSFQVSPAYSSSKLSRLLELRTDSHHRLRNNPVSSTLAIDLAARLHGSPVSIRRGDRPDDSDAAIYALSRSNAPLNEPHRLREPVPPSGAERLQVMLENWQGFIQKCEEDLLPAPVLPLSLYLSRRADSYWMQLNDAVRLGDPNSWLSYFMAAVTGAANNATAQLMMWESVQQELLGDMKKLLPKEPSGELLAVCIQPSFGLADLSEAGLTRRQTASSWMQRLVAAKVLSEQRIGKQKRYINIKVLELLSTEPV